MSLFGCHHLSIYHFKLITGSLALAPGRLLPEAEVEGHPLQSLINPSVI